VSRTDETLILVYKADGGIFAAVSDAVHKLLSPGTYPCSLCAISYGPVSMRGEWRAFLDTLPLAKRFHHRDDFARAWPGMDIALPAILLQRGAGEPEVLVDAATLDSQTDLSGLIAIVRVALTHERKIPA